MVELIKIIHQKLGILLQIVGVIVVAIVVATVTAKNE